MLHSWLRIMSKDETLPRDAVALREKYVRLFEPKAYLSDLLTFHYKWVKITLDYLHETFSKGSLGGVDFLDLGCGPTVHCVLSASRCFQCVTLADVSPHCLDVLRKWLRGGDTRMQEWRNVLEHVARLEGFENVSEGASEIADRTASAVRRIIPCDVLRDPMFSTKQGAFDCIVTSLCLEAAATDVTSYADAVCRVVGHLRTGGTLVMMGVLGCDSYAAGGLELPCLSLTTDDVLEAVRRSGLTDCRWKFVNKWPGLDDDVNGNGWTGAFMLRALKG
ncbi:putative nicotinamide N-methyltransferase [Ixodes scapularis]